MEVLSLLRKIEDPQVYELSDSFNGTANSGSIGSTGWTETSNGLGTSSVVAGVVNHFGVFRAATGLVIGNNKALHLGQAPSDPCFTPTSFDRFRWCIRIPNIASLIVRLGLMQDVSAANGGTAGAFFEFDPATSANWRVVTRQASTSTENNAVAVVANSWYLLEAKRIASGNWEFWINGALRFTHSANLPTTDCNFGTLTQTAALAVKNLDHDYCYVRAILGQLFT